MLDTTTTTLNPLRSIRLQLYCISLRFEIDSCPICGTRLIRPFYVVCSSACDSIARNRGDYGQMVEFTTPTPKIEQLNPEIGILLVDKDMIKLKMKRIKRASKLHRYEKKEALLELAQELVDCELRIKLCEQMELEAIQEANLIDSKNQDIRLLEILDSESPKNELSLVDRGKSLAQSTGMIQTKEFKSVLRKGLKKVGQARIDQEEF